MSSSVDCEDDVVMVGGGDDGDGDDGDGDGDDDGGGGGQCSVDSASQSSVSSAALLTQSLLICTSCTSILVQWVVQFLPLVPLLVEGTDTCSVPW